MNEKVKDRLGHISVAIQDIRSLLDAKTIDHLRTDRFARAAFERFLEIVSEASRHIPAEWKATDAPDIDWPAVANLGNIIRHVYQRVDLDILWSVYEDDLGPLEAAIDVMTERHFPEPPSGSEP
ncbi:DUF86 domain-containing protein [Chenggangzhangella methanolivorans]|uniref:HepT-like ribonuclease domain-containing protein n=1 Tax=Chenggangzhangella methanolivorans TaxID=1437009 RepID=UPI0036235774